MTSNPLQAATAAIKNLTKSAADMSKYSSADKVELLQAMDELRATIEPPSAKLSRLVTSHCEYAVTVLAQDMGIFAAFDNVSWNSMTLGELDTKTKGDKGLLFRVMRLLVADHTFTKSPQGKYIPSAFAKTLKPDTPASAAIGHFYGSMKTFAHLGDFLKSTDYKEPIDPLQTPFQLAHNTDLHYFDFIAKDPERTRLFNTTMNISRGQEWFDFYPVLERLQTESTRTTLVDVGGGTGKDISRLRKAHPELRGHLVLQELPKVIDDIRESLDGIDTMKYDMFDPQPVHGAKAYYLRTVLHDWPDSKAQQILTTIRRAMSSDSILLINENVMQEIDPPAYRVNMDWLMMVNFAALERTENQWIKLIESAGFSKIKIWRPSIRDTGSVALFEARPRAQSSL